MKKTEVKRASCFASIDCIAGRQSLYSNELINCNLKIVTIKERKYVSDKKPELNFAMGE